MDSRCRGPDRIAAHEARKPADTLRVDSQRLFRRQVLEESRQHDAIRHSDPEQVGSEGEATAFDDRPLGVVHGSFRLERTALALHRSARVRRHRAIVYKLPQVLIPVRLYIEGILLGSCRCPITGTHAGSDGHRIAHTDAASGLSLERRAEFLEVFDSDCGAQRPGTSRSFQLDVAVRCRAAAYPNPRRERAESRESAARRADPRVRVRADDPGLFLAQARLEPLPASFRAAGNVHDLAQRIRGIGVEIDLVLLVAA